MKRLPIRSGIAHALVVAGAALLLTPAHDATAVVTAKFKVSSYSDWDAGKTKSSFVSSIGELMPGWSTARTKVEFDAAWATVTEADGSLLVGTSGKAGVYRIKNRKVTKLATMGKAVAVVSLALRGTTLYAGTMPGGEIWTINTRTGAANKLLAIKKAETIWSLALGKSGATLYAGTGPKGKLVRINVKTARTKVVFDSGDKRVQSLVAAPDGSIWLGTSDDALVFRYDPKRGTTRAMADFSGNEITTMVASRGGVLVAANDLKGPTAGAVKTKAQVDKSLRKGGKGHKGKTPATGSKPGADSPTPAAAKAPRKGARKGKGTLYRVFGDGRIEQVHALKSTYFTSIAVTNKGRIFAGAGDKGRIYLIDTNDSVSTAYDVDERMISHLAWDARRGLRFLTGDAAAYYQSTGAAKKSTYESKVFDAKSAARFGRIQWRGNGAVKLLTRTGNTSKPGKGWSKWAAPRRLTRSGGNSRSGRTASPSGRYVQFRVDLGRDAVVRSAALYYLPQNKPTRIKSVTVSASSAAKGGTLSEGSTKPRSPTLKLKWKVGNDDGDTTTYKLAVRREGDALWRTLTTGKKPLTKTSFSWNTETFPDGYYRLRVTSSDSQSNSADRALESQKTSELFLVDNAKPRIDSVSVRYPRATARAVDASSVITEMAFSVDDGRWQLGGTQDGLFDDRAELLTLRLPKGIKAGIHTLSIRVADAAGNVAADTVTFRVK